MRAIDLTDDASSDLIEIWSYTRRFNPTAADSLVNRITSRFRVLAEHPEFGHRHAYIRDKTVLVRHEEPYYIVFRASGAALAIARVVHGARNLRRLKL